MVFRCYVSCLVSSSHKDYMFRFECNLGKLKHSNLFFNPYFHKTLDIYFIIFLIKKQQILFLHFLVQKKITHLHFFSLVFNFLISHFSVFLLIVLGLCLLKMSVVWLTETSVTLDVFLLNMAFV